MSPDVLSAVSDQERKRQEAIFELLSSERNYVDSLKLVKEVCTLCLRVELPNMECHIVRCSLIRCLRVVF